MNRGVTGLLTRLWGETLGEVKIWGVGEAGRKAESLKK